MSELKVTLPDALMKEAQAAGLLTSEEIERMLREQLKTQRVEELFAAMDRMSATDIPVMTPEEVAEEIKAMRAERRNRQ